MAITTYSELQTAVANWMNRTDLTSRIPEFIANAEAHFNRRFIQFKHPKMLTSTTLSVSSRYTNLPTDCKRVDRAIWLGNGMREPLEFMAREHTTDFDDGTTTGTPLYYSLAGTQLELTPAPGSSGTIELYYWTYLTPLSGGAPSNWILEDHPDAYLYRTMFEAALYMNDTRRYASSSQLYGEIEKDIKREAHHMRFGTAPRMWKN